MATKKKNITNSRQKAQKKKENKGKSEDKKKTWLESLIGIITTIIFIAAFVYVLYLEYQNKFGS